MRWIGCVIGLCVVVITVSTIAGPLRSCSGFESFEQKPKQKLPIVSYELAPDGLKKETFEALDAEWGHTGARYSSDDIVKDWKFPNALLVTSDPSGNFVGCVGVQKRVWGWFINHLLVVRERRRQGIGASLMAAAEAHCKKQGARVAHLWCQDELSDYYKKMGWMDDTVSVLAKPFVGYDLMLKTL
jgi:GNAT superfamily N-acetyltransferase